MDSPHDESWAADRSCRRFAPLDDLMDLKRNRLEGGDSQNRQGRHVRSTRCSAGALLEKRVSSSSARCHFSHCWGYLAEVRVLVGQTMRRVAPRTQSRQGGPSARSGSGTDGWAGGKPNSQIRNGRTSLRLSARLVASPGGVGGKFDIRNSKFEIQNGWEGGNS